MSWPNNNITTTFLSDDNASILGARQELLNVAQRLSEVIDSRGEANGVASLDVSGQIPFAQLPPVHRSFGSIHLTLEAATGKVIIKDFIHLTPFTNEQLNNKTNNTIGDLAISTDGDLGTPTVSVYDGTQWKSLASANSNAVKKIVYTVDNTNNELIIFNVPVNVSSIKITAVGAGGGGGSAFCADGSTIATGGTGGAGSTIVTVIENLTENDTIYISVGAGGIGGDVDIENDVTNAEDGADTEVSVLRDDSTTETVIAFGGKGANSSTGGFAVNGEGGDTQVLNIDDDKYIAIAGNSGTKVFSGASKFGTYVVAREEAGPGVNAVSYGSGGGNAVDDEDQNGYNGGAGSGGLVILEY
jgi:hypothetical protein